MLNVSFLSVGKPHLLFNNGNNYSKETRVINSLNLILFYFFFLTTAQAQNSPDPINQTGATTFSNMLNCLGTPTFEIDLTGQPGGTWVSNPEQRTGNCCNPGGDNNCVQFTVTLDPLAEGIIFNVPDGCGAAPSGSLFYQVNCGPLTSVGMPLCLNGNGPIVITFCKPGNNANCYSITSIPGPTSGGDVITADGCRDTLSVLGLDQSSIYWTSISPGTQGQYNNYLNNLAGTQPGISSVSYTGQSTVIVTPQAGFPPVIYYRVCGNVIGACSATSYCDTVSVSIFPNLFANAGPDVALCNGSVVGTVVTGNAIGGTAPFNYSWTGPAGFSQINVSSLTTNSIIALSPGIYTLSLTDATGCPAATDQDSVTSFTIDITANAGPDKIVCRSPIPTIGINATVSQTGTGVWSGGTGNFNANNVDLTLFYTPSAAEISAGFVTLILTPTNTFGCPYTADQVTISLPEFSSVLSAIPANISCFGLLDGAIDLSVSGGAATSSYSWSNGEITQDVSGLSVGNYTVVLIDINGCTGTTSATINQPTLLTASVIAQTSVSCFGGNNGSISILGIGGNPNYTYSLNGSLPQFSGVFSNLIAGTYSITVTDSKGCFVNIPITIIQPASALILNISQTNILCFGESSGEINLSPSGGSPGYFFNWSNGATTQDLHNVPAGQYTVIITDADNCQISSSIILTEPNQLTQTISAFTYLSGTNISCFGLNNGSIDLTIAGGNPSYLYNWSTGETTQDISGLPAGNYSVLITDINGCSIIASITLDQPTQIIPSVNVSLYPGNYNLSGCSPNGWVDLSVSGGNSGYLYLWSNGLNSQDISGLTAGFYSVIITDLNGCQAIIDTVLTQPPSMISTTQVTSNYNGEDITCIGAFDGAITVNVFGGAPSYSYEWFDSLGTVISTIQSPSGLTAGTYTVNIIDQNGCTGINSISIQYPDSFEFDIFVSTDYNGEEISCFGASDGGIGFIVSGGTPSYTYEWTNTANAIISTIEDPFNLPAGTYSIRVIDVNGCQIDTFIILNDPNELNLITLITSDYNGQNVSCYESTDGSINVSTMGGTPNYTYSWANIDGTTLGSNSALTNVGIGTYTVLVTDSNGCTSTANISVNQPNSLIAEITVLSDYFGQAISCEGAENGSLEVTVSGGIPGYIYEWNTSPIQTTVQANNLGTGTYIVIVIDANGCTTTTSATLAANPLPTFNLPPVIYSCEGYQVSIDSQAEPGSSCQWTFSDGQVINDCGPIYAVFPDQEACYDVQLTVINMQGCINSTSITNFICVVPNPMASFSIQDNELSLTNPDTYFTNTSLDAETYYWDFGDGSNGSNAVNPYHQFPINEEIIQYEVTLYAISDYGCMDSTIRYIQVKEDMILYVPNTFTPDGDEFNNVFKPIISSGVSIYGYSLLIFNRWDELIFESHDFNIGWDGTYNGTIVQDGTYIWKLIVKNKETDEKEEYVGHVNILR